VTGKAGVGRVESGLGHELADRPDIGAAERVALRSQARAVDVAEALRNPTLVSEANRVYLDLRTAAGLVAGPAPQSDTFAELVAELSRPGAGLRDAAEP
jgi:hypothetical protein